MTTHRLRTRAGLLASAALSTLFLSALPAGSTEQQMEHSRYGGRLGFSTDPDQITIGGFFAFPEFAQNVRPRPSVDLGFGEDIFSIIVNGDVEYSFKNADINALPYAGLGLALAHYRVDIAGVDNDDTSTDLGLNLYGGLEFDLGGYTTAAVELRFGIHELPDVKVTGAIGFF